MLSEPMVEFLCGAHRRISPTNCTVSNCEAKSHFNILWAWGIEPTLGALTFRDGWVIICFNNTLSYLSYPNVSRAEKRHPVPTLDSLPAWSVEKKNPLNSFQTSSLITLRRHSVHVFNLPLTSLCVCLCVCDCCNVRMNVTAVGEAAALWC